MTIFIRVLNYQKLSENLIEHQSNILNENLFFLFSLLLAFKAYRRETVQFNFKKETKN